MRPAGEVRVALRRAAEALVAEKPGFTWRDAAQAAQVPFRLARQAMRNMARAGELERIGTRSEPGVCRPMTLYAPARPAQRTSFALGASLEQALRRWRR